MLLGEGGHSLDREKSRKYSKILLIYIECYIDIKTTGRGAFYWVNQSGRNYLQGGKIARSLVGELGGFYLYMERLRWTRMKDQSKFGVGKPLRGPLSRIDCFGQGVWSLLSHML